MPNGNHVPQKVLDHVTTNQLKNKFFHVEADRHSFESFFVDKDGLVQRIGKYDDDKLKIIQVTLAEIQAAVVAGGGAATDVDANKPSEAHVKIYVDSLTAAVDSEQNAVSKDFVYANFGMVEYHKLAADDITVRYITAIDDNAIESTVHTIYSSSDNWPRAVADVKALEEVLTPIDGLQIQVMSELPIISVYVFNSTVTKGVAAGDGTTGFWNRIGESGYHAKNRLTPTADVSASTGTDAAKALDGDNGTGWLSDPAADAVTPQIWHVVPDAAFRPNGYSFERTSFGDFADTADEADEGEPGKWDLYGKDGLTNEWILLDSREESVIKDSGPVFYPLMAVANDYVEFKFEFFPGAGNSVTLSEIKITQVEADNVIGIVSDTAANVYA